MLGGVAPKANRTVVFMTQPICSDRRITLRRDLRTLVNWAMTESYT